MNSGSFYTENPINSFFQKEITEKSHDVYKLTPVYHTEKK